MSEERKRARRLFVRRHHPDVGGDPDVLRRGLEAFREGAGLPEKGAAPAPGPAAAPKEPAADRLARGLGRWAARAAQAPAEVREAYREGRDTDTPL